MRRTALAALAALAALGVLAPPAAAEDYDVVPRCEWVLKTVPATGQMLLVLVAEAHATGPTPAAMTTVHCVARTTYGESVAADNVGPGPHAYATASSFLRYDPPTACVSATALFTDSALGVFEVRSEETCLP